MSKKQTDPVYRKKPASPKRRSAIPTVSADILPAVGQAMRLDDKVREWTVLSLWETVVDPKFRTRTRAVLIRTRGRQRQLVVKAADSAVASELTFHLASYQERLNGFKKETGCEIHHIEIRIGT